MQPMTKTSILLTALLLIPCATGGALAQSSEPAGTAGVAPTVYEAPEIVRRYQATITPSELAAHLYLFASDLFEGRETTTRGQKLAAYYLASQYRRLGLQPYGTLKESPNQLDGYMQAYPVFADGIGGTSLRAVVDGKTVAESVFAAEDHDGESYLAFGTVPNVVGNIVFAGYGISDAQFGYDDFAALAAAGIDYRESWLMVLRDEPLASKDRSLFPTEDGRPSTWTTQPMVKASALFRKGRPRGVLVVGDTGPNVEQSVAVLARKRASALNDVGKLSLTGGGPSPDYLPYYVISTKLADRLLAPAGRTINEVQSQIDESLNPVVFEVPDLTLESRITLRDTPLQAENVVAFIEGSDPDLRDEVVLITSHYDHIGLNANRTGDYINNGADDDGSGTVATVEIAEAFMRAKADGLGPRRSLLFANFSGEENGLLGSEYFADKDPLVPLDKIVTVLNIDMIGRIDPTHVGPTTEYVYVIGSKLISTELHEISDRVNALTGVRLELNERFNSRSDPNRFYARSDQWNFGKHGIPFIFFFTGTHEDYHQPGDEPHKIEYARLARIARLIFATAWQVANQDTRPVVDGSGFN